MSIGKRQQEYYQNNLKRELEDNPESILEKTDEFRKRILKEIRKVFNELEGRCETHPDTDISVITREKNEDIKEDTILLADCIALFEHRTGKTISDDITARSDASKIERISDLTRSKRENFEEEFRKGDALYDLEKDTIIFYHLPLELKPSDYPLALEPLVSFIFDENLSKVKFEDIIVHELTHSWLLNNTKIGRKAVESVIKSDSDIQKVSNNLDLYIVDECFAHMSGWVVSGDVPTRERFDRYPEPDKLTWGTKILIDRARTLEGQINIIDWARKTEKRVFDKILQKGQAEHSPMEFLLEAALPKTEFRKLRKLEKIVDKEVQTAFKHLKKSLKDAEKEEMNMSNKIAYQRVQQLEEEVKWHNPEKMKSGLLERIIEKGVENRLSLQKLKKEIDYIIENEAGRLNEYAEHAGNLEEHIDETEIDGELEQTRRELLKASEDIENIT